VLRAYKNRVELRGQAFSDLPAEIYLCPVLWPSRPEWANGQDERLAQHQLHDWQCRLSHCQDTPVGVFVLFRRNTSISVEFRADIVDPDQDAYHIRNEIKSIFLPAGLEIQNRVSAATAVYEMKIEVRKICAKASCDQVDVAMPKYVIKVITSAPGPVRQ